MRNSWSSWFIMPFLLLAMTACSSGGGGSDAPATTDATTAVVAGGTKTYMVYENVIDPVDGQSGDMWPLTIAITGTSVVATDPCGSGSMTGSIAGDVITVTDDEFGESMSGTISGDNFSGTVNFNIDWVMVSGTFDAEVTTDPITCGDTWLDAKISVTDSTDDTSYGDAGVILYDDGELNGNGFGGNNTKISQYFYSIHDGLPAYYQYAKPAYEFVESGYTFDGVPGTIGITITSGVTVDVAAGPFADCYQAVYDYNYATPPPESEMDPSRITRYFKEGIGVVKVVIETTASTTHTGQLANYTVAGDGIVPLTTGNFWIFSWDDLPLLGGPFSETITVMDVVPNGTTYN
jgi:hypothetical protein